METKGIVLIAGGYGMYAYYAYNLALSIRAHSQIPIILFSDGIHRYLMPNKQKVFTEIVKLPEECYIVNGVKQYVKAKVHLYELSPFDETLFLDVDTIFSPYKNIENLFRENSDMDIQFACRGEKKMNEGTRSEWVNLSEIKQIHGYDHWYELSSEVIYFKKCDRAQRVFDCAIYYYTNHGMGIKKWVNNQASGWEVEKKPNCITEFAGGIPDEVPFSLALEATETKIKAPYIPSYWQPQYFKDITPDVQVMKNFYLTSIGGASLQRNTERIYNTLVKKYSPMDEKTSFFRAQVKTGKIPERKRI